MSARVHEVVLLRYNNVDIAGKEDKGVNNIQIVRHEQVVDPLQNNQISCFDSFFQIRKVGWWSERLVSSICRLVLAGV